MTRLQPSGKEIIVSLRLSVVGGFFNFACVNMFTTV